MTFRGLEVIIAAAQESGTSSRHKLTAIDFSWDGASGGRFSDAGSSWVTVLGRGVKMGVRILLVSAH